MVLAYYGLKEPPFGVTPDPRYLFASPTHREALASLLYGLDSGLGFITLTAMPGMGKTTLLFETLNKLKGKAATAFIFQTISTPVDLMKALLFDLGVSAPQGSLIDLQLQLNEVLATHSAETKRVVVVIDEAQNLDNQVLEMVRMLSNFESPNAKLMQIILAGQPQLARKLNEPQLLQLRQRVSISARLDPLSATDVASYIQHRLTFAGYRGSEPLFDKSAVELIAHHSGGIPRNINNLCFNALSIGCATKSSKIGAQIIREVITDLNMDTDSDAVPATSVISPKGGPTAPAFATLSNKTQGNSPAWKVAIAIAVILCAGIFGFRYFAHRVGVPADAAMVRPPSQPVQAAPAPAAPALVPVAPAATPAPAPDISSTPAAQDRPETAPPNMPGHWVRAKPRQSMHSICTENFGICTSAHFEAMLEANASLPNVNKIKPGQRIFVPSGVVPPSEEAGKR
jgi:general secretion pathway protein A